MPAIKEKFDATLTFHPDDILEVFLLTVPALRAVCLFVDERGQPIQLLCVSNLRQCLKSRLAVRLPDEISRHTDYRALVRSVHYRLADSNFEADCIYDELLRLTFPLAWQIQGDRKPAWFIHIDPDSQFPRYTRTTKLDQSNGLCLGPILEKTAAIKFIELVENCFDLCRYHNILVNSPNAKACVYKGMGKCPAPCDGTISIGQYQLLIEYSLDAVLNPAKYIAEQTDRMNQAAQSLCFEQARLIHAHIDDIKNACIGPYQFLCRLDQFRFIGIHKGRSKKHSKIFFISDTQVIQFASTINLKQQPMSVDTAEALLSTAQLLMQSPETASSMDAILRARHLTLVGSHVQSSKLVDGVFLELRDWNSKSLIEAHRKLLRKKTLELPENDEGLLHKTDGQ